MLSITLGPLALPLAPLVLLAAVWVASWLASRLAARVGGAQAAALAGPTLFNAAWVGLAAARLGHLALHADLYAAAPLSMFDLRDGGWHAPTGFGVAIAWLVWRGWGMPALRWPLAVGAATGGAIWFGAGAVLGWREAPPLPPVAIAALDDGASLTLPQAARGRPVVVNLWASWCAPCRQEMPLLADAQQRETGVGFLFVNQGETAAAVRAYLADQQLPLREVWLDAAMRLGPAVGSPGLPTTLFYDAAGRRVDAHFGVINAAALEGRLRTLRATPTR